MVQRRRSSILESDIRVVQLFVIFLFRCLLDIFMSICLFDENVYMYVKNDRLMKNMLISTFIKKY